MLPVKFGTDGVIFRILGVFCDEKHKLHQQTIFDRRRKIVSENQPHFQFHIDNFNLKNSLCSVYHFENCYIFYNIYS